MTVNLVLLGGREKWSVSCHQETILGCTHKKKTQEKVRNNQCHVYGDS